MVTNTMEKTRVHHSSESDHSDFTIQEKSKGGCERGVIFLSSLSFAFQYIAQS